MFDLVANQPKYWDFIRTLRSDERIQDCFVERVSITPEQQAAYMAKHNTDYFVCIEYLEGIDYEIPVGFIGVVDDDIRLAVVPESHGRGIGKFMLKTLGDYMSSATAKVKHNNIPSQRAFISSGFTQVGQDEEFKYYRIIVK
jgi:RimJ/RimL family protein N-acetyltransferase